MDLEKNNIRMGGKNGVASKKLLEVFLRYKERKFVFIRPGGNFGDYLIYRGAEKLGRDAGIEFVTLHWRDYMTQEIASNSVIYIHGGGGFNKWYTESPLKILKKAITGHKGVVINGPQTCVSNDIVWENDFSRIWTGVISGKIYLFTREQTSFQIIRKLVPHSVSVICDHDTAFNLSKDDLVSEDDPGRYVLYTMRDDREIKKPSCGKLFSVWIDPVEACDNFSQWVFLHSKAREIFTDRLHSCIVGTLLGKRVTLLPNSYHKNRSAWEYSLQKMNVCWRDSIPLPFIARLLDKSSLIVRFWNSRFVKKVRIKLLRFYVGFSNKN